MPEIIHRFNARMGAPFLDRPTFNADVAVKDEAEAVAIALERGTHSFQMIPMDCALRADGTTECVVEIHPHSATRWVGFDTIHTRDSLIKVLPDNADSGKIADRLRNYNEDALFVMDDRPGAYGDGPFYPAAIYQLEKHDEVYNTAGEQILASLPRGVSLSVDLTAAFASAASPPELEAITSTLRAHGASWDILEPSRRKPNTSLLGAKWMFAEVRNQKLAESLETSLRRFPDAIANVKIRAPEV